MPRAERGLKSIRCPSSRGRARRGDSLPIGPVPENQPNRELRRCWYSEENYARRERAEILARQKDVELINIALAYVLYQPFPTFPLIGPRQLSETRSSMGALSIELSEKEMRFLSLEEDQAG